MDGGGRWRELRGFLRLIEAYEGQVVERRVKESEEGVEERRGKGDRPPDHARKITRLPATTKSLSFAGRN